MAKKNAKAKTKRRAKATTQPQRTHRTLDIINFNTENDTQEIDTIHNETNIENLLRGRQARMRELQAEAEQRQKLDDTDLAIVYVLNIADQKLWTNDQLCAALIPSERTISTRLQRLLVAGYVGRPRGIKGGTTITSKGKTILETRPGFDMHLIRPHFHPKDA